jgi:hypothetical protein
MIFFRRLHILASTRPRSLRRVFASPRHAMFALAALSCLMACTETDWSPREPVTVNDPDANTLRASPPRKYALPGDTIMVEVRGLKTVYDCSRITDFSTTSSDSAAYTRLSVTARITWTTAPDCSLVSGLDTLVETTAPVSGRTLLLRTPRGRPTDSVAIIAGTGATHEFLHAGSRTDTLTVHERFTFRDSTAGHPRRALYTDALASCEVLQAATYMRVGIDSLKIRYRTLTAAPALPTESFPACTGIHSDTVTVFADLHGWP